MNLDAMTTGQLTAERDRLLSLLSELERSTASTRAQFQAVVTALDRRLQPATQPAVTEHALLRYIERRYDIDVEAIRREMMTPCVADAIRAGASSVTIDGMKFVVKNLKIVTTFPTKPNGKQVRL